MKVKFYFSSQFVGSFEKIVEIEKGSSENDIKNMFLEVVGVDYKDEYCWYEIIENE